MRSAPALDIIPMLRELGAFVKAYDPIAYVEAERELGPQAVFSNDLYETVKDTDACLILTEWDDVQKMDKDQIKQLLRSPILIDGRNLFDPAEMKERGFIYQSIGRPGVWETELVSKAQ